MFNIVCRQIKTLQTIELYMREKRYKTVQRIIQREIILLRNLEKKLTKREKLFQL